jgi:hypothetical protein
MANTLRFKRGLAAGIPTGVAGEPLFTTDTFDLYIGNGTTNTRFQKYIASGTTSQYLRGDGSLATFPSLTGFVPYTGATANVDLGTHTILAQNATISSSGSGNTATITHSSGSGIALNITKGGNGEGLYINKTSGSGNAATIIGTLNATTLVKSGGTSTQYLMADGSVSTLTNPITGTGTAGIIAYWTGTNTQSFANQLYWDNSLSRLGVNVPIPTERLHISGNFKIDSGLMTINDSINAVRGITITNSLAGSISQPRLDLVSDTLAGSAAVSKVSSSYGGYKTILASNFSIYNTTAGDISILNDFASGTIKFAAGGSSTAQMTLHNSGNLLLGQTTNSGQRLQVTGDTLLKGSGNTSATTALTVQNSDGTNSFNVRNDGAVQIGSQSATQRPYLAGYTGFSEFGVAQTTLGIVTQFGAGSRPDPGILIRNTSNFTFTSNTASYLVLLTNYSPTSGTGVFNNYVIQPTINQTGGANGITRGLLVTPTLTAAADWRSIEWSNNTGWGLYGAGSAANLLGGSLRVDGVMAQGGVTSNGINFYMRKGLSGSVYPSGIYMGSVISSTSTTGATMFTSDASTQAASFTLPRLEHFKARQGAIGAGSTVSNQYGFFVESTLNGATNNYGFWGDIAAATGRWNLYMNGTALNYMNGALLLGSTTSSGEKLQVNGTAKITGASSFGDDITLSKNINAPTTFTISNTTVGSAAQSRIVLTAGASGSLFIGKVTSSYAPYKTTNINDVFIANSTAGDIGILNDWASGSIKFAAGGSSTAHLTIASTGAATFSSTINSTSANGLAIGSLTGTQRIQYGSDVATSFTLLTAANAYAGLYVADLRSSTAIAIGTTPDTNKPFKILKNINATVGINFENTNTGATAFSAIQMGTDVAGGTKFTNLVYASSGISASGVYNPDGTSLINNGSGGLNFLGNPIRMYTGGSNGVLRWDMDNDGVIANYNAFAAPTTSATDAYKQYSADVTAGNAAPHFRTENGAVIKLYQETTAVGNSTISVGGGSAVLDDTEFGGYTLRQVVKALQNQGILA